MSLAGIDPIMSRIGSLEQREKDAPFCNLRLVHFKSLAMRETVLLRGPFFQDAKLLQEKIFVWEIHAGSVRLLFQTQKYFLHRRESFKDTQKLRIIETRNRCPIAYIRNFRCLRYVIAIAQLLQDATSDRMFHRGRRF